LFRRKVKSHTFIYFDSNSAAATPGKVSTLRKKFTFIIATPPYDKTGAFTAARVGLTAMMEELPTTIILMEDGVYCGVKGQHSTQFFQVVQVLQDFMEAGGKLLVCGLCIKERGIGAENLIEGAEVIDIHRLVNTMKESDQTVFFGA